MYLLDANIFIQSNRAHYGLDFAPGFWDWLDQAHNAGLVRSLRSVGAELAAGKDGLTTWAAARKPLFVPVDNACGQSLKDVATWAHAGNFTPAAVADFLRKADYELVAFAHTHGDTVVTMETSDPASKKRVKIPDACIAHAVPCMTPFDMLRAESARLVLT